MCFTKPPKYSAKATYQKNRQICYSVGNSIPNKTGFLCWKCYNYSWGAGIRTVEKLRIENPLPNGELTNVEDWKKVVGNAILIDNGEERKAEIHWYQCDGIGKRRLKVKRWKKSK